MGNLSAWWSPGTAKREFQDFLHSTADSTEFKHSSNGTTVGTRQCKKEGTGGLPVTSPTFKLLERLGSVIPSQ